MHFRRPPTLLMLLLLLQCFWCQTYAGWSASQRYAERLELIRFVLNRDVEWQPVLEHRIRLTADQRPRLVRLDDGDDDPKDAKIARVKASAKAVAAEAETSVVAPLSVLRTVARDLAWSGSHVEFAGFVLREAFTCVVYAHVLRVTQMIGTMKNRPPNEIHQALIQIRSTLTAIADSLVAMDGHPDVVAELCKVIDGWLTDHVKGPKWFLVVILMHNHIDSIMTSHCEKPPSPSSPPSSPSSSPPSSPSSPPSSPPPDVDALIRELLEFYDRLAVAGVVAPGSWAQVFDYRRSYVDGVRLNTAAHDVLTIANA